MNLEVVILAAGKGTRMKSPLPKVLHTLAGSPLLEHVVRTAQCLAPSAIHVVVGHGSAQVRDALGDYPINWVEQTEQLGTGHAVLQVLPDIEADSAVLVLYGDVPLIGPELLSQLIEQAKDAPALLTANFSDPSGYGRILRDAEGNVCGVVEDKDASPEQKAIAEINSGILAAPARDLRRYLPEVGNNNSQGEYYLPDVLGLAVSEGQRVQATVAATELDILGVNDHFQLNQVEREYQRRLAAALMRSGVSIADLNRIDVRGQLVCGQQCSIDVNVVFEGEVRLGDRVTVGPNCVLKNVTVGDGATIEAMCHIEDATLDVNCSVGPYARLRTGTKLSAGARVGNFVETKKARIGEGSKVNHLSYIGDCEMGAGVNIGAGTITCNYDGVNKFVTQIGDGVFVGSNSTLVAPLKIEEQGFVAAGSTITRTVASDDLAVGRAKQRNIQGWQRPTKKQ